MPKNKMLVKIIRVESSWGNWKKQIEDDSNKETLWYVDWNIQ